MSMSIHKTCSLDHVNVVASSQRLDGGRAFMASYGRRSASVVSFATLCVLAFYSFNSASGIAIFWGALLLLTQQRFADTPCIDEDTEVGELRVNGFIALLVLTYLTLLPFPGGIGPI